MSVASEDRSSGVSSSILRIALASMAGNALEWYDFFLYGTAAALVFNKLFFPSFDPLGGTLAALATYAVGFAARPAGGALFGHFGDRVGRKSMLVLTLTIMGTATFLIGVLPTYETIGIWAPILLVLLRVAQGIAVGGERGGGVLIISEYAPRERRGFYSAWSQMGVGFGFVLSALVFSAASTVLTEDAFLSWGWRIPFLLSIVLIAIGLLIRLRILETPAFSRVKATHTEARLPLLEVIRSHPRSVLA